MLKTKEWRICYKHQILSVVYVCITAKHKRHLVKMKSLNNCHDHNRLEVKTKVNDSNRDYLNFTV